MLKQNLATDSFVPQGWTSHGQRRWLVSVLRDAMAKQIEDWTEKVQSNIAQFFLAPARFVRYSTVILGGMGGNTLPQTREECKGQARAWGNATPCPTLSCFGYLNLTLVKHLKHTWTAEGLSKVSRKTTTDLKDDCGTRTIWLYMNYWFITERFDCCL